MRYFTYMAEQSFKTDDQGRRLFYLGTPFSRPYMVPDEATEARLFRKMTWYHRISLGAIFVATPFLIPHLFETPWQFLAYVGGVTVASLVVLRLLFWRDMKDLARATAPMTFGSFYADTARRHSRAAIAMGFLVCLGFVVAGAGMMIVGKKYFTAGLFLALFFGLCSVAWGYALKLKGQQELERAQ